MKLNLNSSQSGAVSLQDQSAGLRSGIQVCMQEAKTLPNLQGSVVIKIQSVHKPEERSEHY